MAVDAGHGTERRWETGPWEQQKGQEALDRPIGHYLTPGSRLTSGLLNSWVEDS